jgi:hypothetical protein
MFCTPFRFDIDQMSGNPKHYTVHTRQSTDLKTNKILYKPFENFCIDMLNVQRIRIFCSQLEQFPLVHLKN